MTIPVILASGSPRRHELLKEIVAEFEIIVSDVEEIVNPDLEPSAVAMDLANQKAAAVAADYPNHLVIGADTIVICNGEILGKPIDDTDARRMLTMMSDNTQIVITGISLHYRGQITNFFDQTEIEFSTLTPAFIESYIASGEPFDKAGGYGIQGFDDHLIIKLTGSKTNVIGLPTESVRSRFQNINIKLETFSQE